MSKRTLIIILVSIYLSLAACFAFAGEKQGFSDIWSGQAIAASGSKDSNPISVNGAGGVFGYFLQVTGAGSAIKLEVLVGLTSDGTFYQPGKTATDNVLVTNFGPSSGRNSDGIQVYYFDIPVPLFPWMKIRATELNGQPTAVTFKMNVN